MGPSASRAKAAGSQIQPHCLSQGWGGTHTGGSFQLSARLPQAPGSRAFLHSEYDVALPCIRKLVAGKSDNPEPPCDELGRSQPALTATPSTPAAASSFTKPKVLTAASTLKFIPEELAVFCRDFRLLRFHFQENGLALQAFRVSWGAWQLRGTQGGFVPSSGVLHGFGGGSSCPVLAPLCRSPMPSPKRGRQLHGWGMLARGTMAGAAQLKPLWRMRMRMRRKARLPRCSLRACVTGRRS